MSAPTQDSPRTDARPSASADDARRREIARVMAMSPRERALLALRLGRRTRTFASLAVRAR